MNRAFVSLYLLIVASVIVLGWGLDKFWNQVSHQPVSIEIRGIFFLLEQELQLDQNKLAKFAHAMTLDIQLLELDDLASSNGAKELQAGQILSAKVDDNIVWYKRAASDKVLVLTMPNSEVRPSLLYIVLLVIFYAGIALVIYLWIWPLSRDVHKLERQTRSCGKDAVPDTVSLSPTSPVYALAQAFNLMVARLRSLISSHKEMTNAVSHELRTPLARMKFALAMLENQSLNDKGLKQLGSIQQDVSEMESLVSSLLKYAGFEQESQKLVQSEGHLLDLLEHIRASFGSNNPRHLSVDICDYTGNAMVVCEWKLMETVLQNLINNSARYARTKILIEVKFTAVEFCIAVEDDGPGVPPAERQRAFDSFVRLYGDEQTKCAATGGFGLGLAIVKRIMKWHEGDAQFVEPVTLSGARAEIRWPIR